MASAAGVPAVDKRAAWSVSYSDEGRLRGHGRLLRLVGPAWGPWTNLGRLQAVKGVLNQSNMLSKKKGC